MKSPQIMSVDVYIDGECPLKIRIVHDPKQLKLSFCNTVDKNNNHLHTSSQDASSTEGNKKIRTFQDKWLQTYSWLRYDKEKNFMFCEICDQSKLKNSIVKACQNTNFQNSTLSRHADLPDHKRCLQAPTLGQDFIDVTSKIVSDQDRAILALFKTVDWIVHEDLPLDKYKSLVQLLHGFDVDDLKILKNSKINYESQFTVNEMLDSLYHVTSLSVNTKIQSSRFVTVLTDESTDISNTKRQVIYAQIVNNEFKPETHYVCNILCENATGVGIAETVLSEMEKRGVKPKQIMSLGSDGASAMTGKDNGAADIMRRSNPHMQNVHCIAHRLALCTSHAAEDSPLLKKHQQILTDLFYYLKGSGKREAHFHSIQEVLDSPQLTIKEVHSVRWLSYFEALTAVYRSLDSLMAYFGECENQKDFKGAGLRKKISTDTFIAITYMMMDAMVPVTKLSQFFQTENIDVALVKVKLDECLDDLAKVKMMNTPYLEKLKTDLNGDRYKDHDHVTVTNFKLDNLTSTFIDSLSNNIKKRFPMNDLLSSFAVLGLRSISFLDKKQLEEFGNEEIDFLCEFYGKPQVIHWKENGDKMTTTSDSVIDPEKTRTEWSSLKRVVLAEKYPRDSMVNLWHLIYSYHKESFPNMLCLAELALTSAVHTAGCERGFSAQNRILTKSRCRSSVETQDKLMMIKFQHGVIGFQSALDFWKLQKGRRLYEIKPNTVI